MLDGLFSPLKQGVKLMMQNRLHDAAKEFTEVIKDKPNFCEAHFELGKCNFKLGNYAAAKQSLHKALELKCVESVVEQILEITNWRMISSLNHFNNWPAFSPDGKSIAYISARKDTNGDGRINASDCGGIYVTDIETGKEKYLVSDEFYNSQPVFSPDGRYLVYLSGRNVMAGGKCIDHNCSMGLYMLDVESMQETELLDNTFRSKHIRFSPDGKRVIFSGWRPGDQNSGIYALDVATKKLDILVSGFFENTFPHVSKSGDKLVYSSWRKDTNGDGIIDLRDNSGIFLKDLIDKTEMVISSDEYNNSFPSFSPDGKKILYLSVRRDTNRDGVMDSTDNAGIYMFDLAHNKEYCIVDDSSFNKFPSFTPDNSSVVFISNWRRSFTNHEVRDFYEHKGVYMADVETRKIRRLVSEKYYGSRSPVVSPKGGAAAYISWREKSNRGLYLAFLNRQPSKKELHEWIDSNL